MTGLYHHLRMIRAIPSRDTSSLWTLPQVASPGMADYLLEQQTQSSHPAAAGANMPLGQTS